jgi:hypothetical protein
LLLASSVRHLVVTTSASKDYADSFSASTAPVICFNKYSNIFAVSAFASWIQQLLHSSSSFTTCSSSSLSDWWLLLIGGSFSNCER